MTMKPKPGDRVGRVCGPGEAPRDFKGTVMAVYSNEWYAVNAVILWDNGTVGYLTGNYTQIGIGVYLLEREVSA